MIMAIPDKVKYKGRLYFKVDSKAPEALKYHDRLFTRIDAAFTKVGFGTADKTCPDCGQNRQPGEKICEGCGYNYKKKKSGPVFNEIHNAPAKKKKRGSAQEQVKYKGRLYLKKAGEDAKVEDAVAQLAKVRELVKGCLGLIRDKQWDKAEKLLSTQIEDLQEAKQDISTEASVAPNTVKYRGAVYIKEASRQHPKCSEGKRWSTSKKKCVPKSGAEGKSNKRVTKRERLLRKIHKWM